jgi:hypothetical protein
VLDFAAVVVAAVAAAAEQNFAALAVVDSIPVAVIEVNLFKQTLINLIIKQYICSFILQRIIAFIYIF